MTLGDMLLNRIISIYDACLKCASSSGGSSVRVIHGMDGMRTGNLPRTNLTSGAPARSKAPVDIQRHVWIRCGLAIALRLPPPGPATTCGAQATMATIGHDFVTNSTLIHHNFDTNSTLCQHKLDFSANFNMVLAENY